MAAHAQTFRLRRISDAPHYVNGVDVPVGEMFFIAAAKTDMPPLSRSPIAGTPVAVLFFPESVPTLGDLFGSSSSSSWRLMPSSLSGACARMRCEMEECGV